MKNSERYLALSILMTATLVSGTMLSYYSFSFGVYYSIFCGICFYLLNSLNQDDAFFKTSKHDEIKKDGTVHLAGTLITSGNQESNREERFLENYSSTNLLKRRVFSWIISGSAVYLFHLFNSVPISLSTVAPTFSFLFIVNATSLGQLLIALFINVIIVLISFTPGQNPVFYFIYAFFAFVTLSFITYIKDEGFNKHLQNFFNKRKFLGIGFCVLIFSSMCIGFSYFLPAKLQNKIFAPSPVSRKSSPHMDFLKASRKDLRNLQEEMSSLPESEAKQEILKQISGNLASSSLLEQQIRMGQSVDRESMGQYIQNQDQLKTDFDNLINSNDRTLRKLPSLKIPELGSVSEEITEAEKNNLQGQIQRSELSKMSDSEKVAFQQLKHSLSTDTSQINREKVDQLLNQLDSMPAISKPIPKGVTRKEQQDLLKLINEGRNKSGVLPEQKKLIEKIKEELVTKDLHQVDREQVRKLLDNLKDIDKRNTLDTRSNPDTLPKTKKASKVFENSEKLKQELKEEKESFDWKRLKKILPVLLLLGIFWYLTNRLKKTGIETIETPLPEELPELRKKWKSLQKQKLSPREEVIAFYGFFHECMQKTHYSDHEAPPSCIIDEDLMEITPKLSKSSHALTEIYAQCFYGNKNVHNKALLIFRKAMKNVLKVYQIQK